MKPVSEQSASSEGTRNSSPALPPQRKSRSPTKRSKEPTAGSNLGDLELLQNDSRSPTDTPNPLQSPKDRQAHILEDPKTPQRQQPRPREHASPQTVIKHPPHSLPKFEEDPTVITPVHPEGSYFPERLSNQECPLE
ncbi:hypothetical protein ABW19_dt0205642 [Dactylella cylindrospora]|nr:hypothetical protein ABW19_dt0205642 [Dactylella cylindrospora]